MKKTLLIVAAALAAGMISTQAQNVYSQNVVGYVNQTIPAGAFQIVGSSLVNGTDVNATNGDINATLLTGLVSSPNDPPSTSSNSVIYVWSFAGQQYNTYYYFNSADATYWENSGGASPVYPAGWYDAGGTPASVTLTSGQAAFLQNHSSSPMTLTTVGTVKQGTNFVTINAGYNLISLQVPVSADPANTNGFGLPGNLTSSPVDPPSQAANDTLYAWNTVGQQYATYFFFNSADATSWENGGGASPVYPAGFYDAGGTPMPPSAFPEVNQGFFLHHTGAPVTWTNAFNAQ